MSKYEGLTGVQKAAILFITLGPEISSSIIKRLPEREIQKITFEIANISTVKTDQRQSILKEFIEINKAKEFLKEGGIEYARILLGKALGTQRATEILEKVTEATQQFRPFSIARKADPTQLLNVLVNEHPQTIALVLCYLQSEKSAQIIAELPEELQADVAYRIATMNASSPSVIKEIEKILDGKLSSVIKTETTNLGGIQSIVDILNQVDRTTEKNITASLEIEDLELAEKVKESMFVFEDILNLDDLSVQRILREVDSKDLVLALKNVSEDVQEHIFKNQSKRAAEAMKEDMEYLGPVRLIDVEKAQQTIVGIIRRLDETGEIIMARGGEDAIVI